MQLYDMKRQSPLQIVEWESESALDSFLFANPEALSQALYPEEANRLMPLARQIEGIDILYLRLPTSDNPEPGILICEDKMGANPELRRKVLGQVIDYAAATDQMDETDFKEILAEYLGKPGVHDVHGRCVRSGSLLQEDVDDCLQSAVAAQQNGNIECVICASTIPDQMLQMVRWINAARQGEADTTLLKACKVEKWNGREVTVVAVASALVMVGASDIAAFSDSDVRDLLEKAAALIALPAFHVHLAEVSKTESAAIVESLVPPRPVPSPRQSAATVAASVEEWITRVPTEPIRELYGTLDRELKMEKCWRPGGSTGSQLVLELPISGAPRPLHVLRLKRSGLSLVPFGFLERNGLDEISTWARRYLADLGVKDSKARQPSLLAEEIAVLPNGDSSVVLFVQELGDKVLKALSLP
jgi:hypothetical protein